MEIQMAKMASLHAEGYTDKELQEMDEKEIAEILEDILIDKVVHWIKYLWTLFISFAILAI
jgi:hypothetical protein